MGMRSLSELEDEEGDGGRAGWEGRRFGGYSPLRAKSASGPGALLEYSHPVVSEDVGRSVAFDFGGVDGGGWRTGRRRRVRGG